MKILAILLLLVSCGPLPEETPAETCDMYETDSTVTVMCREIGFTLLKADMQDDSYDVWCGFRPESDIGQTICAIPGVKCKE